MSAATSTVSEELYKIMLQFEEKAKRGDVTAQFVLGKYLKTKKNRSTTENKLAFYWLTMAAQQRHAGAQFILAECYRKDCGLPEKERIDAIRRRKTFELLESAAKQNFLPAICNLAWCYQNNFGVPEQESTLAIRTVKTFEWSHYAATRGDPKALFNLAWCYKNNYGVPANEQPESIRKQKALALYEKSALLGHPKAKYALTCLLEEIKFNQLNNKLDSKPQKSKIQFLSVNASSNISGAGSTPSAPALLSETELRNGQLRLLKARIARTEREHRNKDMLITPDGNAGVIKSVSPTISPASSGGIILPALK